MRRIGARAGMTVAIAALLSVALFPIYWMALTALRPKSVTMVWPPRLLPDPSSLSLASVIAVSRVVLPGD